MSAGRAGAQTAPLSAGVELFRDRVDYHFDNRSSFNTPELVPHFFEQRYVADNLWATVTARYHAGAQWATTAGITPERTDRADDFDTFFNPDGTVWISGTTGDAVMRAFRIEQRGAIGAIGPVTLLAGYALRWDRAEFLVGHKLIIRNGVVVEAFDVDTRETTHAWTQHFFVAGSVTRPIGKGWHVEVDGDLSPATVARLGIELPDKYPGMTIAFSAVAFAASVRARVIRGPIEIGLEAGRSWSYDSSASVSRRMVGVRIAVRL